MNQSSRKIELEFPFVPSRKNADSCRVTNAQVSWRINSRIKESCFLSEEVNQILKGAVVSRLPLALTERLCAELESLHTFSIDSGEGSASRHFHRKDVGASLGFTSINLELAELEEADALLRICNALSSLKWIFGHADTVISHYTGLPESLNVKDEAFVQQFKIQHPLNPERATLPQIAKWLEEYNAQSEAYFRATELISEENEAPEYLNLEDLILEDPVLISLKLTKEEIARVRANIFDILKSNLAIGAYILIIIFFMLWFERGRSTLPSPIDENGQPLSKVEKPEIPFNASVFNLWAEEVGRMGVESMMAGDAIVVRTEKPLMPADRMKMPLYFKKFPVRENDPSADTLQELNYAIESEPLREKAKQLYAPIERRVVYKKISIGINNQDEGLMPSRLNFTLFGDMSWLAMVSRADAEGAVWNPDKRLKSMFIKQLGNNEIGVLLNHQLGPITVVVDPSNWRFFFCNIIDGNYRVETRDLPKEGTFNKGANIIPNLGGSEGSDSEERFLTSLRGTLPVILHEALAQYQSSDWHEEVARSAYYWQESQINKGVINLIESKTRLLVGADLGEGVKSIATHPLDTGGRFPFITGAINSGHVVARQACIFGESGYMTAPYFFIDPSLFKEGTTAKAWNIYAISLAAIFTHDYVKRETVLSQPEDTETMIAGGQRIEMATIVDASKEDELRSSAFGIKGNSFRRIIGTMKDGEITNVFFQAWEIETETRVLALLRVLTGETIPVEITIDAEGIRAGYYHSQTNSIQTVDLNFQRGAKRSLLQTSKLSCGERLKILVGALPEVYEYLQKEIPKVQPLQKVDDSLIAEIKRGVIIKEQIADISTIQHILERRKEINGEMNLATDFTRGDSYEALSQGKYMVDSVVFAMIEEIFEEETIQGRLRLYKKYLNSVSKRVSIDGTERIEGRSSSETSIMHDSILVFMGVIPELLPFNFDLNNTFTVRDKTDEKTRPGFGNALTRAEIKDIYSTALEEAFTDNKEFGQLTELKVGKQSALLVSANPQQAVCFQQRKSEGSVLQKHQALLGKWKKLTVESRDPSFYPFHNMYNGGEYRAMLFSTQEEGGVINTVMEFRGEYSSHPISERLSSFFLSHNPLTRMVSVMAYIEPEEEGGKRVPIYFEIALEKLEDKELFIFYSDGESLSYERHEINTPFVPHKMLPSDLVPLVQIALPKVLEALNTK